MRKSVSIKITGIVQGVFYRKSTWEKAQELGIAGWVRNCSDGSVEIHAEGSPEQLEQLEKWCAVGPPDAVVHSVIVEDAETEESSTFEIRH